jgi:hypothetical protein
MSSRLDHLEKAHSSNSSGMLPERATHSASESESEDERAAGFYPAVKKRGAPPAAAPAAKRAVGDYEYAQALAQCEANARDARERLSVLSMLRFGS